MLVKKTLVIWARTVDESADAARAACEAARASGAPAWGLPAVDVDDPATDPDFDESAAFLLEG